MSWQVVAVVSVLAVCVTARSCCRMLVVSRFAPSARRGDPEEKADG